jgi:hypothetical protein
VKQIGLTRSTDLQPLDDEEPRKRMRTWRMGFSASFLFL